MTVNAQVSTDAAAVTLLRALHEPSNAIPPLIVSALAADPNATLLDVFAASVGAKRNDKAQPTDRRRKRFAGVVVGTIGEQEFEQRYAQLAKGGEFTLADHTKEGTDTDFLTVDAFKRPAFRINVKVYAARFLQAKTFVNLEPEDTFGVATYKVRSAVRKSQREALPYLFAILSCEKLRADAVAESFPADVGHLLDISTLFTGLTGWKTIEDRLVGYLLDPSGYGSSESIQALREAVSEVDCRVISAIKANYLMNEHLDERVPAVSNPEFKVAANSQPNMHYSLSREMIGLGDLLDLLNQHGIQHVATKIAHHEL